MIMIGGGYLKNNVNGWIKGYYFQGIKIVFGVKIHFVNTYW